MKLLSCQKFLCGGRLVFGQDASSIFLTSFMIGCPAITFCLRMLFTMKGDNPLFCYPVLIGGAILTILVGKVSLSVANKLGLPMLF